MLEITLCKDRKRGTCAAFTRICKTAETGCGGQILVTPEQFSHDAERLLCAQGGDGISRYAEVLSFSRLASRVFSIEGGAAEGETDACGQLLMMAIAVEQVRSRLKVFASAATKPEFLLRLIDALEEFRSYCVTPDALRHASQQLSGVLAVKTEEFALLMESYAGVCANCGQNPETRLNRLLAALETGDFAEGKHFYFDGFTDFNGIQREILAQLLADGAELSVYLTCDALEYPAQQFETAQETARQLLAMAKALGVPVELHQLKDEQDVSALLFLRERLFMGGDEAFPAEQEAIALRLAPEIHAQCRWTAGELLHLAAQGVRWRDMSIAFADEACRPVLQSLLRSAEIPAYFAGDRDLLSEPVIRFVLTALEAATGGMEQETVLSYLKSGFSPLASDRVDRMENYILLWNIRAGQWEKPWTMNPYGFSKPIDAVGQTLLAALENDRKAALAPLLVLRDALRKAQNTAQMVLALNDFLETLTFRERLNELASHLFEAGELQRAQEYAQLYGTLCKVLEQTYGVLGRSVRTPEEFFAVFRTALGQYAIGSIPASLDCVRVGDLMTQRRCDTEYLFLLGANEGCFPAAAENRSLLTDSERTSLMNLGIGVSPTADGRLSRELACIYDVLSAPRKRLYLCAVEGTQSFYFRRAERLFPGSLSTAQDTELVLRSTREYLTYLAGHLRELPEAGQPETLRPLRLALSYEPGELTPQTVRALYGRTLRLSSTKIDCLAGCRFAYFLQYGLKARRQKTAELDASLYGTFVHYVLENTVRQTEAEGGFASVPLARVLVLAESFMEKYAETELASLWESERERYLFRRTFEEIRQIVAELYRELSISRFRPMWFELGFSSRGPVPSVRIVGQKLTAELEGFVDRADLWRQGNRLYVRIVDYKTGKKDFDYTNIYNGLGLQMLLYLFALERQGSGLAGQPLSPAGVLYFPARIERVTVKDKTSDAQIDSERQKKQKRQGLLLNDEAVLQAMEPCDGDPRFLPYKINKNGDREGKLADKEQLRLLENHVFRVVAALADELADGKIAPNPYFTSAHNACEWCDYQSLCADKAEPRWLEKLKDEDFWQLLGKEADHA